MHYINTLKQKVSTAKTYEHNLFDYRSVLIEINAIWLLSLVYLLMRIIASFLHYTGYLNVIKGPIRHVLLLSCL